MAYQPIRSLATLNLSVYQGVTAFKRVSKIIDKEIQIKENPSLPELIVKDSDINFNNVNFKYMTADKPTIKDINFSIKGGHGSIRWT